jgi:hypothetical protein
MDLYEYGSSASGKMFANDVSLLLGTIEKGKRRK